MPLGEKRRRWKKRFRGTTRPRWTRYAAVGAALGVTLARAGGAESAATLATTATPAATATAAAAVATATAAAAVTTATAAAAVTAAATGLTVTVGGLTNGRLPASAAYCPPARIDPAKYNISPSVSWSRGPRATRSYALLMTDLDVPKDLSTINQPGVMLTAETPRVAFFHWVLIDIPPTITHLRRGVESAGFVLKGNPIGPTDHGLRGANVYSHYYPKDSPLAGPRGGYDGPCPPHNDVVAHRYVTRVYALDVPSLGLQGVFFGEDALRAMQGHVLAAGEASAVYSALP